MTGLNFMSKIGNDKILHFFISMLLCMSWGCLAVHIAFFLVILGGFTFSMTIGVLKELYDIMTGGKFDFDDILANMIGANVGGYILFIVFYSL